MKSLRSLAALLGLLSSVAALRAAPVNSTITAVTVYADRAVVTRTASVDLAAGPGEVVFTALPDGLQPQSLQVSGRGTAGATILDVSARRTFTELTPNERVKALEDQLRGLNQQARGLEDRRGLLDAQGASLERIEATLFAPPAKDVPRPALEQLSSGLEYLAGQRARLATDRAALDAEREALQAKIEAAQRQLAELRGGGRRAFQTVTVRVAVATPGRLDLTLSYTVPGASWAPAYDVRVLGGERAVQLGYFGLVRQNTGEDWKDVQLTLSTARPSLGGAAPDLPPWALDVFDAIAFRAQEQAARGRMMNERREMSAKAMMAPAPAMAMDMAAPPAEVEATLAAAAVEAGATSATFRLGAVSSVPSDNSPQKVPITEAKLAALPEYATVPKLQPVAYLTSKVTNSSEFPLLAGVMNVFLDGTFVATSRVPTVMPGEKFDLALGADEGISVKHKRVSKFTEDTGLTNSGKRHTYEYLLTLQNNKKTSERVLVTDQLPVSRNEKIVVRQLTPPAAELKPDKEGLLKWTLDLKPGEKRELTVKFAVEHANDVNVTGLE